MNEFKQTSVEFAEEFKNEFIVNRDKFLERGIDIDNEDIGVPIDQLFEYLNVNQTDEFILSIYYKYGNIMGDLYQKSLFVKLKNPFGLSLDYKGRRISVSNLGKNIYSDVYGEIWRRVKQMADSFIISSSMCLKFLDNDVEAKNYLFSAVDFKNCRNWTIVWAKLDWIKTAFPQCYKKMVENGEFLTVEEAEEKMREQDKL